MNKKLFIIALPFLLISSTALAQHYNILSVSYENRQMWTKKSQYETPFREIGVEGNSTCFNGFGFQYIYGLPFGKLPMNLEMGLHASFLFKSVDNDAIYGSLVKFKSDWFILTIPLSYIYHFKLKQGLRLSPYAGIDFRGIYRAKYKHGYYEDNGKIRWLEWFDLGAGASEKNRAIGQIGWHIGARLDLNRFLVGIDYGTDFNPFMHWDRYIHEENRYESFKAWTGNLAINFGYRF